MRVEIALSWDSNIDKVTSNYRMALASLIKEAFNKSSEKFKVSLYDSGHRYKPFTFSIHFPLNREKNEKNFIYLSGNKAILTFSSPDYEYIMNFCNGIQKIRQYNMGFPVYIGQTMLLPNETVMENKRVWHTDAAVFHMYDDEGKRSGYAKEGEYGFNAAVMRHIQAKVRKAFPDMAEEDINTISIQWIWAKNIAVSHYNSLVSCVEGVFCLTAPSEAQQLFYDTGLGARNSQGFGMLFCGEHRTLPNGGVK
ncbi:MAG: CRISPR-associated endoribonuclease Cas6 [Deferribacteraceae bacterium]|jgi:CRISPR-associated endoribonuclease Cas6|nr:CRISPR-associated endoribonuclease Cas6 [Deferribacteraceae bacterium]